jgi:hypothetical protein
MKLKEFVKKQTKKIVKLRYNNMKTKKKKLKKYNARRN